MVSNGRGYSSTPPTVTISAPNSGINSATATAKIVPTYYAIKSSTLVSEYVEDIRNKIESVRDEMNTLSISVIKLNDASNSIKDSSIIVSHAVDDQSAIIEESSSAVTEMAVSIENISKIANERKTIIEKLSTGSKEAGEAIESAADSMISLKNL